MNDVVDIRRANQRFPTNLGWLDSNHSFSFGGHYDANNTGHGQLIVLNDDRVAPGRGFSSHSHADMEIVSWVLDGKLEHRDSEGNHGVLYPGLAQRMSAGRGITHSEMNGSADAPVHFLQMWVVPDTKGVAPSYEERDMNDALAGGELVAVASGQGHEGAIKLHQAEAVMYVGRPAAGQDVVVADAPKAHVFVARGAVEFDGESLGEGDEARFAHAGERTIRAAQASEIVVWTVGDR